MWALLWARLCVRCAVGKETDPAPALGSSGGEFFFFFYCAGLKHAGFSSCGTQIKLPQGIKDLSCLTRVGTRLSCTRRRILNHRTIK